jgi:type IV secretion system protein VirB9
MKNILMWNIAAITLAVSGVTAAVELPAAGQNDARVRYVDYVLDDVVLVHVRPGNVTRIVLESDEAVDMAATGFPSDCKKPELEWCIVADKGMNQIWIKPLRAATNNNLEVKTNKRDYSFEFRVLDEAPAGRWKLGDKIKPHSLSDEPMARVIFRFPKPKIDSLPEGLMADVKPVISEGEQVNDLLRTSTPQARNWNYTVKVGDGAKEIQPQLVFDDGRFTYFKYPKNRQVPAIFAIDAVGKESRLNFTMEGNELVAVQKLSRQFVLRQGEAVVGIWNEAFDGDGVAIQDGVTVDGVIRELKE